ncbi:MFS transporter [Granulicatella adiacens]
MAKELGLDSQGVQKVMRKRDYLTDGLGMVTLNSITVLVGMLTYFYTEKVGVAAVTAANVILITKIVDAFTDLIMGRILDRTNTKYGKTRPWFLRMILPTLVAIIALFTVPQGLSDGLQFLYLLVTNLFASAVVYTAIAIPYSALMVYRTSSTEERGFMGVIRAAFGYVIGMIGAILLIPVSNMLGGNQAAWIKLAVVFGVIAAVSLWVLFKSSKEVNVETPVQEEKEKIPVKEALVKLFKNKYWVLLLILSLVSNISFGLSSGSGAYYAKYVLGNEELVAILGLAGLIPSILGFILVPIMVKKFGLSKTMLIALSLGIAISAIRVFNPASFELTFAAVFLATFSTIPVMALSAPISAMVIDYNDYLYGIKMTGMSSSASSFGAKVGSGIGASIVGWCLAFGAYNASLPVQPDSAIQSIYAFSIYIPLVLLVAMFVIVLFLKPLEVEYPTVLTKVQQRNEAEVHE